jgi:hypothetical protein
MKSDALSAIYHTPYVFPYAQASDTLGPMYNEDAGAILFEAMRRPT